MTLTTRERLSLGSQPGDEFGVGSVAQGGTERGEAVVADPMQVSPFAEEILSREKLPSVASTPKSIGDDFARGSGIGVAVCYHLLHEAEGGGLPDSGAGTAFDEAMGGAPSGKGNGVGKRSQATDDSSECFAIGAVVEQGVERFDIVAAGGPVKGRFGMVHAEGRSVDFGAMGDQRGDCLTNVGEMAGPVGGDVEERPLAVGSGGGEGGVGG